MKYTCPSKGWRYDRSTMASKIREGRILWPSDSTGRPRHKLFLNEMKSIFKNASSVVLNHSTAHGTRETNALLGDGVFDFPKPVGLLRFLVSQNANNDIDIVLDFFAGSGVTGEAVMRMNAEDAGNRRFILVQLPEQTGAANYATISDITKARLRAASKAIAGDASETLPGISASVDGVDLGFKVFRLSSSNIKPWDADFETMADDLVEAIDNIKSDRSEDDVLY